MMMAHRPQLLHVVLLGNLCYSVALGGGNLAFAWIPPNNPSRRDSPSLIKLPESLAKIQTPPSFDPLNLASTPTTNLRLLRTTRSDEPSETKATTTPTTSSGVALAITAATTAAFSWTTMPETAAAAVAGAPDAIQSSLAAYGHFLSLMLIVACIIVERVTIKPNMTNAEEDRIAIADTLLGVFGFALLYSGYLRLSQYEKGWEFYSHEPIFWLKMTFTSVFGAASFFNTTKIIQRAIAKRNGNLTPMSDRLAARMNQLLNAEITALVVIPLTASLMARGVGYSNDFPWQAGAAATGLTLFGLGFKYIKEALEFDDEEGDHGDVAPVVTGSSEKD